MEPHSAIESLYYKLAMFGWTGVDLFFVLSGFLITGILYDSKGGGQFFRTFYMRRFLRIFPLYYGFLVIWFFLILPHYPWPADVGGTVRSQVWSWTYLTNLVQALRNDLNAAPTFTGHFWSLAVEEQFYLVWPFIVYLLSRERLMRVCIGCMVTSVALRAVLCLAGHEIAAYVLTPARIDALSAGAIIALTARGPRGLQSLQRWALPVAIASAAFFFISTFWMKLKAPLEGFAQTTIGGSALAIFFGAVLVMVLIPASAVSALCRGASLRFLGRYSYGLYVIHLPVAFFVTRHAFFVADFPKLLGSQLPAQALFHILAGGISIGIALVSWHVYEKQFLKLKNRFPYHRGRPAAALSPNMMTGQLKVHHT